MSEPAETPRKPRIYRHHRIRKIERYDVMQAFKDVWEAKQKSRNVNYKAIAEKWSVNSGTLRQYWSEFTKGRLDPGLPMTTKDVELTARGAHEKQLLLLKRTQAFLLSGMDEGLMQIERGHAKGGKVVGLMKRYDFMETIRMLKATNEMIAHTERGYLALLDEYSARMKQNEKQLVGEELHRAAETMTDEARAIRALQGMATEQEHSIEVPTTVEMDVTQESPSVGAADSSPAAPDPAWNRTDT